MIYNSDKLIELFKINANIPNNSKVLTNEQILDKINQEITSTVIPLFNKLKADYFSKETVLVANSKNKYRTPERAIHNVINSVFKKTPNGSRLTLALLEESELGKMNQSGMTGASAYWIEGNYIVPVPATNTDILYCSYPCRPNKLVALDKTATITDVSGKTVTFAVKPSLFTNDSKYDVVTHKSGSECIYIDLTVASSTSTTITFNEDITDLVVGDYLCLAGETPVPNLPEESHNYILCAVVVNFLQTQPDPDQLKIAQEELKKQHDAILGSFADRTKKQSAKLRPDREKWR